MFQLKNNLMENNQSDVLFENTKKIFKKDDVEFKKKLTSKLIVRNKYFY